MTDDVTRWLDDLRSGDSNALPGLLAAVSAELREVAARHLGRERRDHTLQPTALVHEAYLKLVDQRSQNWESRTHFLSIAATAMRRILIEHARARLADKRGGGARRVELPDIPIPTVDDPEAVVQLEEALVAFESIDPENARIVELRWFGGLDVAETATTLGVSTRTVERGWRAALAWLRDRLSQGATE